MTLDGAMKESIDSIRLGFYSLLPACDDLGRAIIFNNTWSKVCLDANGCFPIDADEVRRTIYDINKLLFTFTPHKCITFSPTIDHIRCMKQQTIQENESVMVSSTCCQAKI